MHRQLPHVVGEVTGETGRAIMRAMLAGERDPVPWARRRHERGHHDEDPSATARRGPWRAEPLWAVAQAVALADVSPPQIGACDRQRDAPLGTFAERQDWEAVRPMVRPRPRTRHRPRVDGRGTRHRLTGGDLTAMAGLDEPTALTLIRASGLARGRWPTVKPVTSGRGRGPHHRVCGGPG